LIILKWLLVIENIWALISDTKEVIWNWIFKVIINFIDLTLIKFKVDFLLDVTSVLDWLKLIENVLVQIIIYVPYWWILLLLLTFLSFLNKNWLSVWYQLLHSHQLLILKIFTFLFLTFSINVFSLCILEITLIQIVCQKWILIVKCYIIFLFNIKAFALIFFLLDFEFVFRCKCLLMIIFDFQDWIISLELRLFHIVCTEETIPVLCCFWSLLHWIVIKNKCHVV
jgi:hypothetical protein